MLREFNDNWFHSQPPPPKGSPASTHIKINNKFFSAVNFFHFLAIKTLNPD
jgi:hypothetical protein